MIKNIAIYENKRSKRRFLTNKCRRSSDFLCNEMSINVFNINGTITIAIANKSIIEIPPEMSNTFDTLPQNKTEPEPGFIFTRLRMRRVVVGYQIFSFVKMLQ